MPKNNSDNERSVVSANASNVRPFAPRATIYEDVAVGESRDDNKTKLYSATREK
jgi:hypothetical protein